MSENNEKFVGGMRVTRHEKTPDFVKASIGVNIRDFIAWADKHSKNGWVNFQVKESKGGELYAELDTWEKKDEAPKKTVAPSKELETIEYPEEDINPDSIPF